MQLLILAGRCSTGFAGMPSLWATLTLSEQVRDHLTRLGPVNAPRTSGVRNARYHEIDLTLGCCSAIAH
jgi:hypothetical protein